MNNFLPILLIIAGILFRFGIPIVITFLLSAGLQKLDKKWREEAVAEKNSEIALQPLDIQITPCWIFNDCPEIKFANCDIPKTPGQLCWDVKFNNGKFKRECMACEYKKNIENEMVSEEIILV